MAKVDDPLTVATSLAAGTPVSPSADTIAAESTGNAGKASVELGEGTRIGKYTLLRRLGAGGMGVVYAARDGELARDVALKLLREDRGGNVALETRLQREAQAMAKLAHESVARVFDVGTYEGHVFLAMELIDGVTLGDWLARESHSWREIVDVYRAAGRGLAEAHAAGIIHRDFKPGNVMIDRRGRVVVTDFGLARSADIRADASDGDAPASNRIDDRLTRDGALVGTPRYMAPEQLARKDATALSDQFAFAVSVYEGVAGTAPFRGDTTGRVLEEIQAGRITPARMAGWLRRVLVRAMAADPARRFPSMEALLAALDRGRKRPARLALGAGVLGLAAGSAALAAMLGGGTSRPSCERAAERVSAVWTPLVKSRVMTELPRLRPGFGAQTARRVVARLDDYARQLGAQRIAACKLTVGETPAAKVYDPVCLDDELRSLEKVASAFADSATPELVDHADDMLGQLTDCDRSAAQAAVPPEPAQRAAVNKLRDSLADADVLVGRGDYAGARTALVPVVASARQLGYGPALAEALQRLGHVELQLEDPKAGADLTEAAKLAASARDDRSAVRAWTDLLTAAGNQPDHPDLFTTTVVAAETEAARTGAPGDQAAIDLVKGHSFAQSGKLAEGLEACQRALATLTKLHGDIALELRPALHCLGQIDEEKGDYPAARDWLGKALAIDRNVLGDDHPETAEDLQTLGELELRTGNFKHGLELATQAIAVRERAFGAESDAVAKSEVTIANLLIDSGHPEEALPHVQRGIAIATKNHGPDSAYVAPAYASLGTAYTDMKRRDEAVALFERAIAINERIGKQDSLGITLINLADVLINAKKYDQALRVSRRAIVALEAGMGKDSPIVGFGLYDTARCLNHLGKPAEALPLLERAVAMTDPKTSDPNTVAIFEYELARSLWMTGGDHKRALTLAHDAHAKLVAIGNTAGTASVLSDLDGWLATHH